jgi:hypothetical protein
MYMAGGLTCHLLPKVELKFGQFTFPIPNISTATHKLPLMQSPISACTVMMTVTCHCLPHVTKVQHQHGSLHIQITTTEVS